MSERAEAGPVVAADTAIDPPAELLLDAPIPLGAIRGLRPQLTPRQARQIDRLSRRAHRFHRFAHHPLCGRYAGEVIRIGRRTRLCRGCTLAAAGALAGGIAGLAISAAIGAASFTSATLAIAAAAAATLVLAPTVVSTRRVPKLVARAAPAALFALALVTSLAGRQLVIAAAVAAIVAGLRILYGRRGGDRTPCATCPERMDAPCSGFVRIVRREQAFQRITRRWLA